MEFLNTLTQNSEFLFGYYNGSWLPNEVAEITGDDFQWGAMFFPAPEGSQYPYTTYTTGCQFYGVTKNCEHPEAAVKLLEEFTSVTTQQALAHYCGPYEDHCREFSRAHHARKQSGEREGVGRMAGGPAVASGLYAFHERYGREYGVVGIARTQASDIWANHTGAYLVGHYDGHHYGYQGEGGVFRAEFLEEHVDENEIERYPYPFSCDERHSLV